MDHSLAKSIFEDIQNRPYQVSTKPGEPANNCYFKNIELLQKLAGLGYTIRGRVCETFWDDKIIPQEVLKLNPKTFTETHFFGEIYIDDKWHILDASFQPALEKHGFKVNTWYQKNQSCFPVTKLYSQEESINYQKQWFSESYAQEFFKQYEKFFQELNKWFESLS